MNYLFSGFKLNTEKKKLSYQSELVNLTKQNFQLLHFFVKNPGAVLNKDQLIENVWNGRIVADNSIDQSIYKLKKILSSAKEDVYFETVYGLGIKFVPSVKLEPTIHETTLDNNSSKFNVWVLVLSLLFIISSASFFWWRDGSVVSLSKTNLVIVPHTDIDFEQDWLSKSSDLYIGNLIKLSTTVSLKNYQEKPANLNQQQYLESQWKLNPQLKVLSSKITLENDLFHLQLSIKDNSEYINEIAFQSEYLTTVYSQALEWLNDELNLNTGSIAAAWVIPQKPYLLELYLRGLSAFSQHKTEQAINYFELCLENDPDYHLATLELTKLLDRKGDTNKALALLNTVLSTATFSEITIEATNQKGGILLRQGKPQEAKTLYLNLLNKYHEIDYQGLLITKYKLALVYRSLFQKAQALEQFDNLETALHESDDYESLADVYQAQGSILLSMGETQKAIISVQKAMELFVKLGNLLGQAKTHSVSARIARQSANYSSALTHLRQALNITKGLNHKFGTGATLNEIISVLLAQGKLNEAWKLNQELEKISIQIDFTAMLLASKRYTIIIAELREHWIKANIYIKEHFEIAQAANNRIALVENKFLSLSIMLKQNKLENVDKIISDLEAFIYQSKEQGLRLKLNILKAHYLFQSQLSSKAQELLLSSKILAKANEDTESFIQINDLLAKIHLENKNPVKALEVLQESMVYNPPAWPDLLLRSKARYQLNEISTAINLANRCKLSSYDLWTSKSEQFLVQLLKIKNSEK